VTDDLWAGGPPDCEPPDLMDDPPEADVESGDDPAPATGAGATPFVAGHGYARRFPTEALPEKMAAYVRDLAYRKQVPVDLPAITLLGALGSVAGPRIVIRRDLDWTQPTNLYTCVAMGSGGGKTPTVDEIRNGMLRAKKVLAERHTIRVASLVAQLEREVDDLRLRANNIHTPIDEREGLRLTATTKESEAKEMKENPPPPPELVIDGDTGPEALGETMAANYGCGPLIDDEGTFFRNLAGQYGNGKTGNLSLVLVGYDCRYYRPKRVTRTAAGIPRAAVSLVISPQPSLVASAMRNQMMDELGFINRFVVCVPGDLVGQRQGRPSTYYRDEPSERPDLSGRKWWSSLIERLVSRYDVIEDAEPENMPTIDLTRAAWKRHYEYGEAIESRCHPATGDLRKVAPWATKHAGRVLRVAALLHLAAGNEATDELQEPTMENAIVIGDWMIEHFLAAGKVVGLSDEAGRIQEYIDGTELGWATRTAISKDVFKGHAPSAAMEVWIGELVATGRYEVVKVVGEKGGRAREMVRRRPRAK
jgi:hypothetical protein